MVKFALAWDRTHDIEYAKTFFRQESADKKILTDLNTKQMQFINYTPRQKRLVRF